MFQKGEKGKEEGVMLDFVPSKIVRREKEDSFLFKGKVPPSFETRGEKGERWDLCRTL